MKNSLPFILILVSSVARACLFYPEGESVRFSLLNPKVFDYGAFEDFNYSSEAFNSNWEETTPQYVDANAILWSNYCGEKVAMDAIKNALYEIETDEIHSDSYNQMICYLYEVGDNDALEYLKFAKSCEVYNSHWEDPWERQRRIDIPRRNEKITAALDCASSVIQEQLKRRYFFLAIRMAWYNEDFPLVESIFKSFFESTDQKDILYYWSLYFKSLTQTRAGKSNFYLAQVFKHAPDKRFSCYLHFNRKVEIADVLQHAKNSEERANVYLLYGVLKPDKALDNIRQVYAYEPSSEGLSFLLLREINKIEDFIMTPYYFVFEPSTQGRDWYNWEFYNARRILNRSERDRLYAKELLAFAQSVNLNMVENPILWQTCDAYLSFFTRDYNHALSVLVNLKSKVKDTGLLNQLTMIEAIVLTARQSKGKAIIVAEIEPILLANKDNLILWFAIGRELEYLGNTTKAALLYSKIYSEDGEHYVFWRSSKFERHSLSNFFYNFIDYVDAVYTPEQVDELIRDIERREQTTSAFSSFIYDGVEEMLSPLYDIMGTKYIRQNKLEKALVTFSKLDNRYWSRTYGGWGDRYSTLYKNPFYHLKYTEDFIQQTDTFLLNKYSITKRLIEYLARAESKDELNRDYYYFLVANAYYNMGREGNASMMRRIIEWNRYEFAVMEDEEEFRQSILAKKYYLLAMKNAKTDKFRALCLRMAARCEKNRLLNSREFYDHYYSADEEKMLHSNLYYRQLKRDYSEYFDDLASGCENFGEYFEARR